MTKIYTKSGDDGTTALGGGIRVSKSDARVEAYGTVDELNSILGVVLSFNPSAQIKIPLLVIQNLLFDVGADLAFSHTTEGWKPSRIQAGHIEQLENWIDELVNELPELRHFILPGGSVESSYLHVARTVCRRAERLIVDLVQHEKSGYEIVRYMNRLSDLLFVMARFQNQCSQIDDVIWKPE